MKDWRALYDARNWAGIEDWFYHTEDLNEMAALRARLRRDVPRIARSNGTEETEEYVLPHEVSEEWRGAAEILHLGELDAILDGEPPTPLHEWHNARVFIENKLLSFVGADEVTEGEPALSRRGHAK